MLCLNILNFNFNINKRYAQSVYCLEMLLTFIYYDIKQININLISKQYIKLFLTFFINYILKKKWVCKKKYQKKTLKRKKCLKAKAWLERKNFYMYQC